VQSSSFHCCGILCNFFGLNQDSQIVLLLNGASASSESSGDACMMIVQASELPFKSISRFTDLNLWNLYQLKVPYAIYFSLHLLD